MKRCLVTGAAGFIGSHLVRRLLSEGNIVIGIDSFTDYYERSQKERNLAGLAGRGDFTLIEGDLVEYPLGEILDGVELVFHLAAQAGVRASWGDNFRIYTDNNVLATQRLLEACLKTNPEKVVYASSSSVYGDTDRLPVREDALPAPVSPYGVTKLAAEHLCRLYWKNFGLPAVSLRYFTVYGPGQRPDMAFHRFLKAIILDQPLVIFGDGEQTRDFTFIDDIVEANMLAAAKGRDGEVYNIGGGHRMKLKDVIGIIKEVTGQRAQLEFSSEEKGDVKHTHSDTSKAVSHMGFLPRHDLEEGIKAEFDWLENIMSEKKAG